MSTATAANACAAPLSGWPLAFAFTVVVVVIGFVLVKLIKGVFHD